MKLTRAEKIQQLTKLYHEKKFLDLVRTAKIFTDEDGSSAQLWNFLALGYRYTGETNRSISIYENLLVKNPTNFLLNANAGNLFLSVGRIKDAMKCFELALSKDPKHTATIVSFGIALTNEGKTDRAKLCFEKVLELEPSNEIAHFRLGRILQLEEDFVGAAKHYDKTNYDLSKTHQLECYYLANDKDLYFEKFLHVVKNTPSNPLMSTIACHAAIRFGRKEDNPFCNEPMNYVFKTEITSNDGLTSKLIDNIIKIKETTDLKTQPLLNKGAQSSGNLFLKQEPEIVKLREILEKKIFEYRTNFSNSTEGFIQNWPKSFSLFGWLVSIKSGGTLKAHMHREGWLSGSIYLKMPKKQSKSEGNILFGLEGSYYPSEGKNYPEKEYEVNERNLVLFPSSLYHQTLPFSNDEDRISFAFDVIPNK